MKVCELAEKLNLEVVNMAEGDAEVTGCYIGDMLSVVMSKAEEGDVWLTVQANVNIAAVAALTGCAAIIIVEGMTADNAAAEKAKTQGITIFRSDDSAYGLACKIRDLI